MSYRQDMAQCAVYIQQHCREDLTARQLADLCGYSFYHFCHVFRACIGTSPGAYLRRARLAHAAQELQQGRPVTQVALEHGFDTPGGFNKAFRKEFGVSPSRFRLGETDQEKESWLMKMDVRYEDKPLQQAICWPVLQEESIDPASGADWARADFSGIDKEAYAKVSGDLGEVGLWLHPGEVGGELTYYYGPLIDRELALPAGAERIQLPAGKYAVFTANDRPYDPAKTKELQELVQAGWGYVFREWFEESGREYDQSGLRFEVYRGFAVELWVPIK